MNYEDQRKYMQYFGTVPRTRAERKNMNTQINRINREEYEAEQDRQQEEMNEMFMEHFGRLPQGPAEARQFLQQIRQEEDEERRRYENGLAQEDKLVQLHKYHPNLNITMAEELQMRIGNPIPFKRYIRRRKREGISENQAINEYAQGGIVVEGVGKGPNRQNAYANAPKVLKKANARRYGLIPDPHYKPSPNANNGTASGAYGGSGTRRRKRHGGRRRGRTSRK
jgi:hypothetical protein